MKRRTFFSVSAHFSLMQFRLALLTIFSVALRANTAAGAGAPATGAPLRYSFHIFNAPNTLSTNPHSINKSGQVTGNYGGPAGRQGFLYSMGTFTTLNVHGAQYVELNSINTKAQVTGYYSNHSGTTPGPAHGFVYSAGNFSALDVPDSSATYPTSINDKGEATGSFDDGSGKHGFFYSVGKFTTLSAPAGTVFPLSINQSGQITGSYADQSGVFHGFLYTADTFATLDVPGAASTSGHSINDRGQVTGWFDDSSGVSRGFVYTGGTFGILDAPGAIDTYAFSINSSGQVTGTYSDPTNAEHGFVYSFGSFSTLDAPGASSTDPRGINDSGQVVGTAVFESGILGFIATPLVSVLDNFDRDNGKLGPNWKGSARLTNYKIMNQSVRVTEGGPIYWQPNSFGVNQEAFVTLTRIDADSSTHALLLKVQGETGNYKKGAISVSFDGTQQMVRVATWRSPKAGWQNYRNIPVTFADGDKLRARVLANGKVKIYRNQQRVGTITLRPNDRKFFGTKTGRVGLWFENAPNAILDGFGGGTRIPKRTGG